MNGCGIKVAHACPARSPFHTARPRGDYVTLPPSYLPYRAWYFIPVFWGIYTSSPWGLPQEPFGGNAIQTATPMISPWSRLLQNSITHSFPLPRRATSTLYYKFSLLKHHLMPPSPVTAVLMSLDGPSLLSSVPVCLLLFSIPLFPGPLLSGTSDDF